ncbi:Nephrin [Gryllus bimaculatus]|nr:Nephrin [Gryllus bimaculatus]
MVDDGDGKPAFRPYSFCNKTNKNLAQRRPAPRVTWWQANALLDDTYESAGERRVRNNLYIDELERKQLLTVLTCQAINNNLTVPLSAAVTIDLNPAFV